MMKLLPNNIKKYLGKCRCIYDPRGDHGLEGFQLNEIHLFQVCYDEKGKYYRVFPNEEIDYYETCGPIVFKKYFEVIHEKST